MDEQMWNNLLNSIFIDMHQFGLKPQPPCGEQELIDLNLTINRIFGINLPNDYLELLAIVDGLDWNGLIILASQQRVITGYTDRYIDGILDRNLAYRDNLEMARYLVLGEDGTVMFSMDCHSGQYVVLSTAGLSVLESYATCSELLSSAMTSHL